MKAIKYIPLIIFLIGTYWASRLSIIDSTLTGEIPPSIIIINLFTILGYLIWFSWLIIFLNNKSQKLNIILWSFTLVYHIVYIVVLFPFSLLFFYLWPVVIAVISLFMLFYESGKLIINKTNTNKANSLNI
jgi:hypothetical protein